MAAIGRNDRLLLHFRTDLAQVHERLVLTKDLDGGHYGVTPERAESLHDFGRWRCPGHLVG